MTTRLILESDSWALERNGKMNFKQEQLFHLHRLSLLLSELTGERLRFRTRNELEHFLAFASTCSAKTIQSQLDAVRNVLPFRWTETKRAVNYAESPLMESD